MSPLLDDLSLPPSERELERRKVLGLIGSGALGLAAIGTGVTTLRYLEPNVFFEPETRFAVGRPEDLDPGTVLVLPRQKVYVVRTREGVYALSTVCTHLGCVTRYDREGQGFACPCHGSRFALGGEVTTGPAPRPLPRLEVKLERGLLVVNTARRVAPDFLLVVPA